LDGPVWDDDTDTKTKGNRNNSKYSTFDIDVLLREKKTAPIEGGMAKMKQIIDVKFFIYYFIF